MSTLTFRNSKGNLVEVPVVPASQFKNNFGSVVDKALRGGAIAITKHAAPHAVLLSYAEFASLSQTRGDILQDLSAQFDGLLANMQSPKARQGMQRAFDASPAQLRNAVKKAAAQSTKKK